MSFKLFIERYLDEKAKGVDALDTMGVYDSEKDNVIAIYDATSFDEGLTASDMDIMDKAILGVLQYKPSKVVKGAMEVYKVTAEHEYGPLTYLVGMQKAKEFKKGLMPYSNPNQVKPEAKNVWSEYYDGKGAHLVKKIPTNKKIHKEEYLNHIYTNIKPIDLAKQKAVTVELLKDDPYNEKAPLMAESILSKLENAMRQAYPEQ
jgi:hypothetical protein